MVHNLAEFPAAVACAYASYRISGWFSAVLVQRGAPCCGASFYFSIQEYYVHDSVDGSRRRAPASRIASLQDCRTSGSHQCHCRSPRTGRSVRKRRIRRGARTPGVCEGRILELEGTLSNAQIIDPAALEVEGQAVFGATVDI